MVSALRPPGAGCARPGATEDAALRLSILTTRGAKGVLELLRERTVLEVWEASRAELVRWSNGRPWVNRFIVLRDELCKAEAQPPLSALGCSFVPHGSRAYSPRLLELDAPPAGLYLLGDPVALVAFHEVPRVTIVGTRKASAYGLTAATALAVAFAQRGVCVLSGLALGIDGRVHRATLERKGLTVGVLGCGVDVVYPRRHRDLHQRLAREGGLISEYPPGAPPAPWTFPERNRLLAALSDAVVVVEAPERSGALITAEMAMELGREVFAVPGPIGGGESAGCNRLIYDGAGICLDAESLVEDFLRLTRMERRARKPRVDGRWRGEQASAESSDPARSSVLEALRGGAQRVEDVARSAGLSLREASAALSLLELDASVRRCGPGAYVLR